MPTSNSSASPLLSAGEYLKRADARTVGDLCSDTGERVPTASLPSDANLAAALLDAQGVLESAVFAGAKYTPDDLAALTGAGQAALYRLLKSLTDGLLYQRRPDLEMRQPWVWEEAMRQLDLLREGKWIFGLLEQADAGRADHHVETATEVTDRQGTAVIAGRYFGRRGNRRDPNRP